MQNPEEQAIDKPRLTCLNFIYIYLSEAGIGACVTGMSVLIGWLSGSMTYNCDQYIGYPVGPSPANDLTSAPNATTCPPQLNQDSYYMCFKPACEKDMKTGKEIGGLVGAGLTATALAATGLFQAGYIVRRRFFSGRAVPSEATPILSANTNATATDGRANFPFRQMRTDSRTSSL